MRKALRLVLILAALAASAAGYTKVMAHVAPGTAPDMAPADQRADMIRLDKSDRRLELLRYGEVIRSYTVSLGAAPEGHKTREGDERTPEGAYTIDWRNARSVAHLSLHISYPNAQDQARATAASEEPGGAIMIHGLPNGWGFLGAAHRTWDWTDGCIAVTNAEMREIWSLVPDGTPIVIEG